MPGVTYVFTHTDLDGVGAAAAYLLVRGIALNDAVISFVEPYNLHTTLEQYLDYIEEGDIIAIMDLGQTGKQWNDTVYVLGRLIEKGAKIEWYDHHIWEIDEKEKLGRLGVKLFVDTKTCATGVVSRYSRTIYGEPRESVRSYLAELEASICAADLWRWDHPLAPKLFRIVSLHGSKGDARRRLVLGKFVSLTLWDDELEEILVDYVNKELKNYRKIDKSVAIVGDRTCRIAGVLKPGGPPSNSFIGAYLLSRFRADIAVIIRENGGISLRSRDVDVQKIARKLGGGGHPRAAGAKVELGILDRILKLISPKLFASRILRRVAKTASNLNVC